MARLPRLVLPGHAHLVVQRALPGRAAFTDGDDVHTWLQALREGLALHQVQLHAWAVWPEELRLVLTPPDAMALARLMQHLGRRYVAAHHRRHGGSGTLWDGRYRCAALEPGAPVLDAMAWIDGADPAAAAASPPAPPSAPPPPSPPAALAALAAFAPGARPAAATPLGSSAARHLGLQHDTLLTDPPVFWALGNTPFEREGAWRQRLATGLPPAREAALQQALRGGWAVGSAAFAASAANAAGRPARPRPRGRPSARD